MDKLQMQSKNLVDENIDFIAKRFPNCVTEAMDENGKLTKLVDFEMLKQELSHVVIDGDKERYTMTWPDKKQAILTANAPISKTLRPCKEESVGKDGTVGGFDSENLYIEGDNLDVLKLLRETYLGKVKMIYIDPPYNTGKDSFIYNDNMSASFDEYIKEAELRDENNNRLFDKDFRQNNESNGRFHTDWLNMIYPRLKLAKDLLTDDGVILISIDENEIQNLFKICDEVFGKYNFIENFIWIKNSTKNLSKTTSTNHEYILCYAKDRNTIESDEIFRVEKPGLKDVQNILEKSINENLSTEETEKNLKEFYKSRDDLKGISMYDRVDCKISPTGRKIYQVYRLSDISAPKATGKADTYDVIHPITGRVCKCPASGWRFTKATMLDHIKNDLIYFYEDETHVPQFKRYLDTVTTEVVKSTFEDFTEGKKELMQLFEGNAYFENAKPTTVIKRFLKMTNKNDMILDFFSGSGTTAHALFKQNAEDGGKRRFICVQLPEKCEEKSEALKAGFLNICELGKERIRRAGKQVKDAWLATHNLVGQVKGFSSKEDFIKDSNEIQNHILDNIHDLDIGFRVLKLDSSCMKDVYYSPNKMQQDLLTQLEDNIKEDRTPEDLLFQVMLDMGVLLSSEIKTEIINGKTVFNINDGDLVCCFDKNIDDDTVTKIAKMQPLYAVFRDSSIKSDSVAVNFDQIFETYSSSTERRII